MINSTPVWDVKGPLNALKYKIYAFFKSAFYACSSLQLGEQVRFCDVASLYYQLLRPWDNDSDLINSVMDLACLFDEKTKILNAK
jgi:hypothetical protein